MPKQVQTKLRENSGIWYNLMLVAMVVVNMVVLYGANMWFPEHVVVGTQSLTVAWGLFLSSSALAVLGMLFMPVATYWESMMGRNLKPMEMMGLYFVENVVGLWLVTRVSDIFGLGVSSWMVILALAVVMDLLQGVAGVMLEKVRLQK